MNFAELTTIRDFIRYAASEFSRADLYFGHGTDNAWDDAFALILHTLHLSYHMPTDFLDAHLIQSEKDKLNELIQQRIKKRMPVPYLTHEAWFAGLAFYVDERVLIPRSPIAELIEKTFEPWTCPQNVAKILDLCTGSGCIAIACANYFPNAMITASDISEEALAVAKINLLRHHVEDRVKLCHSNLFSHVPNEKFNIIVSNPPYVSAAEIFNLPPEYLHEPNLALLGGENGLHLVTKILSAAPDFLTSDGILVLEVGNSEEALMEKYANVPFMWPELEKSDGGVFILDREQLLKYRHLFTG